MKKWGYVGARLPRPYLCNLRRKQRRALARKELMEYRRWFQLMNKNSPSMKGWPRQCGDGVVKLDLHSFMTSQGGNNITPRPFGTPL